MVCLILRFFNFGFFVNCVLLICFIKGMFMVYVLVLMKGIYFNLFFKKNFGVGKIFIVLSMIIFS